MLINAFIVSWQITDYFPHLTHLYRPLISFNLSLQPPWEQMFRRCYRNKSCFGCLLPSGSKSKSSLTCKYLYAGVLLLNSKCYLRVMKSSYHHRDNSSCLLDASQIQISFVYWNGDVLSSGWGNYLCRDTQKLHLPAARKWKSLSVIGGFGCPERSSSASAADTLDLPTGL